jgi:acetolactate synthase-1/2/3 large subunit
MGPDYTRFRDPRLVRPQEQTLVQVDIDPRSSGWVYPVELAITGDVGDVVRALTDMNIDDSRRGERVRAILALKSEWSYDAPQGPQPQMGTMAFIDVVRGMQNFITKDDIITLDAGNSRIWMTNALRMTHQNQLLAPGGAGGMGWGGPAAAAVKLAFPKKRVTCIAGDGGFMMTVDVVATCAQHKIPATFIVLNNRGLGMVRDNLGEKRIACDFPDVDFAKMCAGMGANSYTLTDSKNFGDVLRSAHAYQDGPSVIDVKIDPHDSHRPATDHMPLP